MRKKNEKQKKAVALKYSAQKDGAPKLAAKGRGKRADRIIAIAKEHGIPIQQDSDMVEVLSELEIDNEIPPDLYKVIAELLAFIYKVNGKAFCTGGLISNRGRRNR
ncbi:MAG: flagellar biosynthetic protein FlhB [bacterium]|nr:MAG: flagellar biosynthetic protein FlhB [bacterium]